MPRFMSRKKCPTELQDWCSLQAPRDAGCCHSWLLPLIVSQHWATVPWGGNCDAEPKKCCQSHFPEGKEDSSRFLLFSTMFCWRNNFKDGKEKPQYCVSKMENSFLRVPRYLCAILPIMLLETTLPVAGWLLSMDGFATAVCTVPSFASNAFSLAVPMAQFICMQGNCKVIKAFHQLYKLTAESAACVCVSEK